MPFKFIESKQHTHVVESIYPGLFVVIGTYPPGEKNYPQFCLKTTVQRCAMLAMNAWRRVFSMNLHCVDVAVNEFLWCGCGSQ